MEVDDEFDLGVDFEAVQFRVRTAREVFKRVRVVVVLMTMISMCIIVCIMIVWHQTLRHEPRTHILNPLIIVLLTTFTLIHLIPFLKLKLKRILFRSISIAIIEMRPVSTERLQVQFVSIEIIIVFIELVEQVGRV